MFPLVIVLSVLLRFTDLISPLVSSNSLFIKLAAILLHCSRQRVNVFLRAIFFKINWKTVAMSSLTLYSPNVISGVRWRVLIRKPCVIL